MGGNMYEAKFYAYTGCTDTISSFFNCNLIFLETKSQNYVEEQVFSAH